MICLSNFEIFLDLFGDGESFSVSFSELKIELSINLKFNLFGCL